MQARKARPGVLEVPIRRRRYCAQGLSLFTGRFAQIDGAPILYVRGEGNVHGRGPNILTSSAGARHLFTLMSVLSDFSRDECGEGDVLRSVCVLTA